MWSTLRPFTSAKLLDESQPHPCSFTSTSSPRCRNPIWGALSTPQRKRSRHNLPLLLSDLSHFDPPQAFLYTTCSSAHLRPPLNPTTMFSLPAILLLAVFLTTALAARPHATTYKPSYTLKIPAPATLLSKIPCMKICECEVVACMKVCRPLKRSRHWKKR
jgi:hypothetical protein